jgi:predicted RND superfamily exporter protein
MLACIVLGAGVDYAVHLVASWNGASRVEAAGRAAENTGPAIWINAVMIAAGFIVLTLGEAKPLQNVGSLTAASMLAAAAATFLAIPVLARRRSYRGLGAAELDDGEVPELVGQGSEMSNQPRE